MVRLFQEHHTSLSPSPLSSPILSPPHLVIYEGNGVFDADASYAVLQTQQNRGQSTTPGIGLESSLDIGDGSLHSLLPSPLRKTQQ